MKHLHHEHCTSYNSKLACARGAWPHPSLFLGGGRREEAADLARPFRLLRQPRRLGLGTPLLLLPPRVLLGVQLRGERGRGREREGVGGGISCSAQGPNMEHQTAVAGGPKEGLLPALHLVWQPEPLQGTHDTWHHGNMGHAHLPRLVLGL